MHPDTNQLLTRHSSRIADTKERGLHLHKIHELVIVFRNNNKLIVLLH